jgi:transposase-like protein
MSEPQLPREVRRRLAIIQHADEVTGNVAMTCRYYGISRQVYYRWLRSYREQGVDGLRDLSRRPRHSPNATPCRRGRQDSLSTPELPFRARQDRDVPQALSRR